MLKRVHYTIYNVYCIFIAIEFLNVGLGITTVKLLYEKQSNFAVTTHRPAGLKYYQGSPNSSMTSQDRTNIPQEQ